MLKWWIGRRTLWVRLQFGVGVVNAYFVIDNFDQGRLLGAAISAFGVYLTARWPLPAPTDPKEKP